ncbi:MAG TPA: TPM domain-containing protein [Cyclobacteriaceae bacterium]|nr:TPM domain-containing protein [Cyclobacteriaceae bacterium]HMV08324.1 TPM domain-containing protein [Cyclobacteriaceae bacterium]HMV88399.1 TPM domain-containing protein [Cyclobacteriaceae bacterium]HMX02167.1 TPM domain-containing protein [Cyclobacteriaceae bacterium]HMX49857.1 TPM domain-containing protein [Cyclobacteriaceae bacterium]
MKTRFIPFVFAWLMFEVACGTKDAVDTSSVFIRDSVQVLTQRQYEDLAKQIKNLEDSIGSQIGIILIKTLRNEPIEEYSLRTANAWVPDSANKALITVAIADKQMRIEVGSGLENIITNDLAAEIIRDDMTPEFRKARYYEGLSKAVERISALIHNNRDVIGQQPTADEPDTPSLDGFLVDAITDTAVQELSGSLVLIVQSSEKQISEMEKEYSEEELSTIFDDASFYQSEAAHLLDSLGVKNVTSSKRFVRYRNVIREWNFDLEKQNSPWVLIFLEAEQRPEVVLTTDINADKIRSYFNLK